VAQKDERYQQARASHKIYCDKKLHLSVIKLVFSLFLARSGLLHTYYADQYPLNNRKMNIPYLLFLHINHPENASLVPDLCEQTMTDLGAAHFRLLKLLCTRLFRSSAYKVSDMT
jgi:hypothetical protein